MATRSTIAILRDNGTVAQIYCHWDGYLDNNGKILVEHYTTPEKIEALIALGSLSSLGAELGEKHPFDIPFAYGTPEYNAENERRDGICTAYGRDRGETGTEAKVYKDLATYERKAQMEEYNYVFMHGEWTYVSDDDVVRTVKEGLELEAKEAA
jgi:hypothetical protein